MPMLATAAKSRIGSYGGVAPSSAVTLWLDAAKISVWPSGDALATLAVPIAPPAPGRLSMIAVSPSAAPSSEWNVRARTSRAPPAAKGTTMRITLPPGCAAAKGGNAATAQRRIMRIMARL